MPVRRDLFVTLAALVARAALAQSPADVRGTVTTRDGRPIAGAVIVSLGTRVRHISARPATEDGSVQAGLQVRF